MHRPPTRHGDTVPARFDACADRVPEATIAVVAGGERLTYRTLARRADRLAARLRDAGARPGRLVGVALPRSSELVVALLAVLKSGAAYLPLDPAYPARRLALLLAAADPVAVLSSPDVAVDTAGIPRLDTGTDAATSGRPDGLASWDPPRPDDAAYVIHTSGSTGAPKGVVVPHRNVLALLDAAVPLLAIVPDDVWTAFHSSAFDFSVWELWGPLLTGGRTVVVPAEATWSAPDLLRLLDEEQVTVLSQTPSSFAALDRADAGADVALERLRLIVLGGEELDPPRLRAWTRRRPDRPRVVNMYGITETTVHVTAGDVEPAGGAGPGSPVGTPLPGFRAHVLDPALRPVPEGVYGELYLGGDQLARGYLGQPGLTAARFVADPAGGGGRLYRTGDRMRRVGADLFFGGRCDVQLSLRGFRIEPGEVESVLDAHDDVAGSAVTVRPDPDSADGDECLVAYVVGTAGPPDDRALRRHLAERLPAHLVPGHVVVLPDLPLTPNRKLDRAALPPPPARRDDAAHRRAELLRRRVASASTPPTPGGRGRS